MSKIDERIVSHFDREDHGLGKAERAEAEKVAQAAYKGNTTLGEAVETGVRYVKEQRESR